MQSPIAGIRESQQRRHSSLLALGILLVLIPVGWVIEDGIGNTLEISLVPQDVFVIISLPDVTGIQFAFGAAGDGGLETGNKRSQGSRPSV